MNGKFNPAPGEMEVLNDKTIYQQKERLSRMREHAHETVLAQVMDDHCCYQTQEAVALSELKHALESAGRLEEFTGYCDYEVMKRQQCSKQIADIDADTSFTDDYEMYEDTAEYKREYAQYLANRDLKQALFWCREQLMATMQVA